MYFRACANSEPVTASGAVSTTHWGPELPTGGRNYPAGGGSTHWGSELPTGGSELPTEGPLGVMLELECEQFIKQYLMELHTQQIGPLT